MFRLLLVGCLLGAALGDTVVLNQVIDQLLSGFSAELVKNKKDSIAVSEMRQEWKYRWHFIKVTGHCKCWDGYARSLASLRRTGDVSMTTDGNRITLRAALGLGTLEFGFRYCQLKADHLFSVTQEIDAEVSSNSIEAQITLVKNGDQCVANVDKIGLANLGDVTIKTGGSVLHQIEDKLLNWLIDKFHSEIVNLINDALESTAKDNINKANLCDKIPH